MESAIAAPSEQDEAVAREICTRQEYAGRAFRLGEFVAILDGQVVAVGSRFEYVERVLSEMAPDPDRGLICRVEPPVPDVIR